jgi:hypothetical protein
MTAPWIAAFVLLWLVVIAGAVLFSGTLRRIAPVLERAEEVLASREGVIGPGGIPPGSPVPEFEVTANGGDSFGTKDLIGKPAILVFMDEACLPCRTLMGELEEFGVRNLNVDFFAVFHEPGSTSGQHEIDGVRILYEESGELSRAFRTSTTPHAFAIDAHGTVVDTGTPNTFDRVLSLAERARKGGEARAAHEYSNTTKGEENGFA